MSEAARLVIEAVACGWRHLSRTRPKPTPPRYALRMQSVGRWAEYIGKPNIIKKLRQRPATTQEQHDHGN